MLNLRFLKFIFYEKKGWIPYNISYSIIPTENTSHFEEYFSPINISIGKYKGVPYNYNKIPRNVYKTGSFMSSTILLNPKSAIFIIELCIKIF